MSNLITLLDPERGEQLREAAIDRVDKAASKVWKAKASIAIQDCARAWAFFTTDQVEERLNQLGGLRTHDMRALGPAMRRAQASGVCEPTNQIELSSLPQNHRRPKRVWRSTRYDDHQA